MKRATFTSCVSLFYRSLSYNSTSTICRGTTVRNYSRDCFSLHTPVMCNEVFDIFKPNDNQKFLDLTFGAGGHASMLINSSKKISVYALDRDPTAYNIAVGVSNSTSAAQVFPLLGRFSDLPVLLSDSEKLKYFDGILIDCGCSSMQFDTKERGFSLSQDGPLDMRMDQDRIDNQPSAADILASIDEKNLCRILKVYGEEKNAKKIARAIVEARYLFTSLKTTKELAQLVETACGISSRTDKLQRTSHVATKTFQALRILVNDELNELDFAMRFAYQALKIGGKIVAITFHSLEDRIVKSHLCGRNDLILNDLKYKNYASQPNSSDLQAVMEHRWQTINKHVLVPSPEEVKKNPRSRSAKLRAAVRLT